MRCTAPRVHDIKASKPKSKRVGSAVFTKLSSMDLIPVLFSRFPCRRAIREPSAVSRGAPYIML